MNTDQTNDPLKDLLRGLECFVDPRAGLIYTHHSPICVLPWKTWILVDVFAAGPLDDDGTGAAYTLTHYGLN